MILAQIVENKKKEIEKAKGEVPLDELKEQIDSLPERRNFLSAISHNHQINLIAEVKKSSPSKGVLRENFSPVEIAEIYELNGAVAISVVTDKKFFSGDLNYINDIRKMVSIPILRKDFIIDEYQIFESAVSGSDAFLLICDILSIEEISHFMQVGSDLNMHAVIEVHSEEDLEKALEVDAEILGINNRNLQTFKVDLEVTTRLVRLIPKHKVVISESGIKSHEDVMRLKSVGINVVLVGEALIKSRDIAVTLRQIIGH